MNTGTQYWAPPPRLKELLWQPGGISRARALTEASQGIETLREQFTAALSCEMAELGRLAMLGTDGDPAKRFAAMTERAGMIFNLAGTFGFFALQDMTASLLDLLVLMEDRMIACPEPIRVHLEAASLVGPGAGPATGKMADALLSHLRQVNAHFTKRGGCASPGCGQCARHAMP